MGTSRGNRRLPVSVPSKLGTGHAAPPGSHTSGIPAIAIAPLSPLDGEKGRRTGLLEPWPPQPWGKRCFPHTPIQSSEALQGPPPPLLRSRQRRSPVSPLKGRPGELASSHSKPGTVFRDDGLEDLPVVCLSRLLQARGGHAAPPGILWRPSSGP